MGTMPHKAEVTSSNLPFPFSLGIVTAHMKNVLHGPVFLGQMASPPPLDKGWRMGSWIKPLLDVSVLFCYKKIFFIFTLMSRLICTRIFAHTHTNSSHSIFFVWWYFLFECPWITRDALVGNSLPRAYAPLGIVKANALDTWCQ